MKRYWLVKTEPEAYSWSQFSVDATASWTGVRNFQARNFLREMQRGDCVLFYHSVTEKAVVGIAKVKKQAFPDPTAKEGDWVAVELIPDKTLTNPVSLEIIKKDPLLKDIALIRQSRLSVLPLKPAEYKRIVELGEEAGRKK